MRVVASVPMYPPGSRVGAWITTHTFLAHLAAQGHQVDVVTTAVRTPSYTHDGVNVHGFSGRRLADLIADTDIVVAHLGDVGHGAMWSARHRKPLVRIVHSDPHPTLPKDPFDHLAPTALAIFNSEATRVAWAWDGPSVVIHPPLDPAEYRVTPGDRVTLVNLSAPKGGELFWHLAATMPGHPFLAVVGGYGKQVMPTLAHAALLAGVLDAAPNVQAMPPQNDIRAALCRTRILLVPSERESYGRIALEAMCSGIPVIAHPTPGLREACGDAAIWCDRAQPDQWRAAIATLDDHATWRTWSDKALDHAGRLEPAPALDRFATVVSDLAVAA